MDFLTRRYVTPLVAFLLLSFANAEPLNPPHSWDTITSPFSRLPTCLQHGDVGVDLLLLQDVTNNYGPMWESIATSNEVDVFYNSLQKYLPGSRIGLATFSSTLNQCFTLVAPLTDDLAALKKGTTTIWKAIENTKSAQSPDSLGTPNESTSLLALMAATLDRNAADIGWTVENSDLNRAGKHFPHTRRRFIFIVTNRLSLLGADTSTGASNFLSGSLSSGLLSSGGRHYEPRSLTCHQPLPSWAKVAKTVRDNKAKLILLLPDGVKSKNPLFSPKPSVLEKWKQHYNFADIPGSWLAHLEEFHTASLYESFSVSISYFFCPTATVSTTPGVIVEDPVPADGDHETTTILDDNSDQPETTTTKPEPPVSTTMTTTNLEQDTSTRTVTPSTSRSRLVDTTEPTIMVTPPTKETDSTTIDGAGSEILSTSDTTTTVATFQTVTNIAATITFDGGGPFLHPAVTYAVGVSVIFASFIIVTCAAAKCRKSQASFADESPGLTLYEDTETHKPLSEDSVILVS